MKQQVIEHKHEHEHELLTAIEKSVREKVANEQIASGITAGVYRGSGYGRGEIRLPFEWVGDDFEWILVRKDIS